MALKWATMSAPSRSPRSAADRWVTRATSGNPQSTSTRTCPAEGPSRVTRPRRWLRALEVAWAVARRRHRDILRAQAEAHPLPGDRGLSHLDRVVAGAENAERVLAADHQAVDKGLDPDESRHRLGQRRAEHGRGHAHLRETTADQDGDTVGKSQRLRAVVRDEDGGGPILPEDGRQIRDQRFSRRLIECRERLVQQQELRVEHEGARQRRALRLTARQGPRLSPGQAGDLEPLEPAGDPGPDRCARHSPEAQSRGHVVEHRGVGEKRLLEGGRGATPKGQQRLRRDGNPAEPHDPGGWRLQQSQDAHQGGLASAIGADGHQHLAALDVQRRDLEDCSRCPHHPDSLKLDDRGAPIPAAAPGDGRTRSTLVSGRRSCHSRRLGTSDPARWGEGRSDGRAPHACAGRSGTRPSTLPPPRRERGLRHA